MTRVKRFVLLRRPFAYLKVVGMNGGGSIYCICTDSRGLRDIGAAETPYGAWANAAQNLAGSASPANSTEGLDR